MYHVLQWDGGAVYFARLLDEYFRARGGVIICSMGTKSVHKHDYNVFYTARHEFEQWSSYTWSL